MPAGAWIRKPQPPLSRDSWLPREVTETPLERFRRIARERAEQAAAQAYWDEQWRRDMLDIEYERRLAGRRKRESKKPRPEPSFTKHAYTRAIDTGTRDKLRDRFEHEDSTARIVGDALEKWMLSNGLRPDEYRWHRSGESTQAETTP